MGEEESQRAALLTCGIVISFYVQWDPSPAVSSTVTVLKALSSPRAKQSLHLPTLVSATRISYYQLPLSYIIFGLYARGYLSY